MTKTVIITVGAVATLAVAVAGVRIGLLLSSVALYKAYWQKEAAKTPESGALVYIALGDSTAQGIGASSARRGYVGLVAEHLARKTGKPVHVINISVSGAKLADAIAKQLPQLKKLPKPDYVTIEIGANDMPGYNSEKFRLEFSELLNGLPSGTYVANMPSYMSGRLSKFNTNAVDASELIAELMATHPDLRMVDVYDATRTQNILDFGADLFHPSNRGYKNWAHAFIKELDGTL